MFNVSYLTWNFYFTGILFLLIIFFSFFCVIKSSEAAVDLPWSTTFDCDEWDMVIDGYDPDCDGIAIGGTGIFSGFGSRIMPEANMADGLGGSGWRQLIGDGTNQQTAPFYVTFSGADELWIRWYLRYQEGFIWGGVTAPYPHYHKLLYIDVRTGQYIIPESEGSGFRIGYYDGTSTGAVYSAADEGWPVLGDGEWHCLEAHVTKTGTYQMWIDESLIINETNVTTMPNDFTNAEFGTNQNEPDNDDSYYVDWDDVAISTTGYIGPIESLDTTPPSYPTGLNVE
jgi:hypothetical protein